MSKDLNVTLHVKGHPTRGKQFDIESLCQSFEDWNTFDHATFEHTYMHGVFVNFVAHGWSEHEGLVHHLRVCGLMVSFICIDDAKGKFIVERENGSCRAYDYPRDILRILDHDWDRTPWTLCPVSAL